ncbi:hypothetical protein Gasu2_13590 [Galdieria sulphuraria]|uniref:Protein MIS12 homolog n=1 Tax=Galdieria sulphuraria TaxID=130081 RepID=M2XZN1_GALSU|nr:uncharacterized protein Gasu_36030 [Galdieria sulphuraria]EME29034.1 hypothetical protein Gasu_36030 [Galdieria sulphuraria]GJD06975.1 hypothetical protein Gasu2_13590 [Galdieria sulphuraria]|eukprot:XP_005705554.1 hypothetical protein Gasu_36030 [Galdieria sulphuraria]
MNLSQPLKESSTAEFLQEDYLTSQASLLRNFQPMEFFSELFQTVDNVLCDCLDSLKASLDEKCFPTQYQLDIEKGIQALQYCLVEEGDYQFDLLELFSLYNIFRIPSNLDNMPPSLTYSYDCPDIEPSKTLDDDLEETVREIKSLRYCKKRLERELRLLNSDLNTFDVIRLLVQRVANERPSFLAQNDLQTTMNDLKNILKSSEQSIKLKQQIERTWVSSVDEMPPLTNPRLELDVSDVSLADIQKMTLKLKHQF